MESKFLNILITAMDTEEGCEFLKKNENKIIEVIQDGKKLGWSFPMNKVEVEKKLKNHIDIAMTVESKAPSVDALLYAFQRALLSEFNSPESGAKEIKTRVRISVEQID